MRAENIKWDIDYDENGKLPTEVDIPEEVATIHDDKYEADEKIAKWLSDTYGYCHGGFIVKLTEDERKEYCKDCARSIYDDGPIAKSCDMNISDNGYYNHANWPCHTKVANKEKRQITEEMGIHKEWYKEANEQTLDTLMDFINHLMNDYYHDYGTICHAMAASMMATMWAIDHSDRGGITGFQASHVMWQVVRNICYRSNVTGLKITDYDDMLFPQYAYKFDKVMSSEQFAVLQSEAEKRLKENEESEHKAHPTVVAHWTAIAAGIPPFGYRIKKENNHD